ncbi:hypothetical protein [Streptomyces caeruleatus]|uniref:hypothetical protein n=1 Tax=Streptomyces caeruleatus TaxID=661399 RepID=UPI00131AB1F7|nr:hypothetical protein [Streptomyces caeruleatus]
MPDVTRNVAAIVPIRDQGNLSSPAAWTTRTTAPTTTISATRPSSPIPGHELDLYGAAGVVYLYEPPCLRFVLYGLQFDVFVTGCPGEYVLQALPYRPEDHFGPPPGCTTRNGTADLAGREVLLDATDQVE